MERTRSRPGLADLMLVDILPRLAVLILAPFLCIVTATLGQAPVTTAARLQRFAASLPAGKAARELHHEAGIDALGAGRNALAAAAAHRSPVHGLCGTGAAGDQVYNAGRGFFRVRFAEPRRRHHWAGAKACAAARAGLADRLAPRPEIL